MLSGLSDAVSSVKALVLGSSSRNDETSSSTDMRPSPTSTSETLRKPEKAITGSKHQVAKRSHSSATPHQDLSRGTSSGSRRRDHEGESGKGSRARQGGDKSSNRFSMLRSKKESEDNRINEIYARVDELEQENTKLNADLEKVTSDNRSLQDTVDNSKIELRNAMETIQAKEEDARRAGRQADDVRLELDQLRNESRFKLEKEQSVTKRLQASLERKGEEYRALYADFESIQSRFQELDTTARAIDEDRKRLKTKFDHQSAELDDLRKKYDACKQMLDLRTKELLGAQEYLHSTRTYSGADLIRLVESLNGEIMQAAASITDTLDIATIASKQGSISSHRGTRRGLSLFLAEEMVALFHNLQIDDLDVVMQSALQAAISYQCTVSINAWSPEEGPDTFLRNLFQKQGPSPASGRWRAITKTHTKYAQIDQIETSMCDRIFDAIVAVIRVAGLSPRDKDHEGEITKVVKERVAVIVGQTLQIDKIVGLEMTSEELEVYTGAAGEMFRPETLQDVFEQEYDADSRQLVLCTTDMGLRCRQAQEAEEVWQVMLKAKVLLEAAFAQ